MQLDEESEKMSNRLLKRRISLLVIISLLFCLTVLQVGFGFHCSLVFYQFFCGGALKDAEGSPPP